VDTLDIEAKRSILDGLYQRGLLTEAQAEDYREAYLRVPFEALMDADAAATQAAQPSKPQGWPTARGGLYAHSIGRPSKAAPWFLIGGDGRKASVRQVTGDYTQRWARPVACRPAVAPPVTYKDRTRKSGPRAGQKRWTPTPYILGEARLALMVEARQAAFAAIAEPSTDGRCGPGVYTDTEAHGSPDGRHAVCLACSARHGRVILGASCVCTQPDVLAEATVRGTDGTQHHYAYNRLSGEVVAFDGTRI
jgi:hypothetical protein